MSTLSPVGVPVDQLPALLHRPVPAPLVKVSLVGLLGWRMWVNPRPGTRLPVNGAWAVPETELKTELCLMYLGADAAAAGLRNTVSARLSSNAGSLLGSLPGPRLRSSV